MNILLTGSNGFLGSYIFKHLSRKNNIYTLNSGASSYNVNLTKDVPLFNEHYDIVIHAAGKAHIVPKTESEIFSFDDVNVNGTVNLLQGLINSEKPKMFVFISSVSVYGLTKGENINEEYPLLATDPYGASKIKAEEVVKKWCKEHNILLTILRLPLVVGSNPPGNLGAMINGIKKSHYFNISGGNVKKSMVLASDIAKFILNAAEIGGVYNLTDGIHPTFFDLSKNISQKLGKSFVPNLPVITAKTIALIGDIFGGNFPLNSNKLSKITSTLTFDDTKARNAFGWKPTQVLEGFKLHDDA